jgi:competence protein ComEA
LTPLRANCHIRVLIRSAGHRTVPAVPELPPRQLIVCGLALLAVLVAGGWFLARDGRAGGPPAPAPAIRVQPHDEGRGSKVVVHVAGAVREPGVYRMPAGARVDDAVGRAGGATRRADLSQVNLAAELEDGRQVLVPERMPAAQPGTASESVSGASAAGTAPGVPLNLNTATLEQLDQLDGIGPVTAQNIIDYREEHGGFGSVEELGEIPGIGDVRLASLREQVRV